uniref:Uncharacterized protein n=1 Tax=Nothobranchius kuhntae TaxID=321403 RepID=A0A1A8HUA3_NOTKU
MIGALVQSNGYNLEKSAVKAQPSVTEGPGDWRSTGDASAPVKWEQLGTKKVARRSS